MKKEIARIGVYVIVVLLCMVPYFFGLTWMTVTALIAILFALLNCILEAIYNLSNEKSKTNKSR